MRNRGGQPFETGGRIWAAPFETFTVALGGFDPVTGNGSGE